MTPGPLNSACVKDSRSTGGGADRVGKRLLILGGNRYNVPSIRAARRAGFHTIVADRNPLGPGLAEADVAWPIDLLDVDALQAAVERFGGVDGVVTMAEVGVRPAAELSARLGLAGISREAAQAATSKATMRRRWAALARLSADFRVVRSAADARRAVAEIGPPVVFKPDLSFGGSRGVQIVEDAVQAEAAFAYAQEGGRPNSEVVIERRLYGNEFSAEALIWRGETSVLCIGRKVKSAEPWRVDLSVQYPAPLAPQQESRVAEMCRAAVSALGLEQGVAHVEFCWTEQGPVLFELGARCGGGHTPQIAAHVSGVDEFIEYCRMSCGLAPAGFRPMARRGADYRFLVFPPGRVVDVDVPADLLDDPSVLDVGVTVSAGDEMKPIRSTADRAGFVVTVGKDREEAVRAADRACERIRVRYENGETAGARPLAASPFQRADDLRWSRHV